MEVKALRNDGTHLVSERETLGNLLVRCWLFLRGWLFTIINRFRFKKVGKKFRAPYPISVVNGANMVLGDNVYLGRHCRLYAYPTGELTIGNDTSLDHDVELRGGSKMIVGNNVRIVKNATVKCGEYGDVRIGDRTLISEGCILNGDVRIGEDVVLGPRVFLNESDHGYSRRDIPINQQGGEGGTIIIERNVWLGYNVSVLKKVTIGEGAIIGTNGVVTKDVAPFSIMVGIPAKVLRMRE